ncbi:hypothetical protein [Sphingobium yanoikuyae]|uniref:hypothetical protein n=1 Tax=Sphingobium yanoikuyae TaxID=13690 RepID=UPI000ABD29C3|nr:hypothetical protein [Sphingobium yanoikuyae]
MGDDLSAVRAVLVPASPANAAFDYFIAHARAAAFQLIPRTSEVRAIELQWPDRKRNPFSIQTQARHLNFYLRRPILEAHHDLFDAAATRFGPIKPNKLGEYRTHIRSVADVDVMLEFLRQRGAWPNKPADRRFVAKTFDPVTKSHFLRSARHLAAGFDDHPFGQSTDYDLLFEGHRLPPKAVFGLAASEALGFPVRPENFSAGNGMVCFRRLRASGFQIVAKAEANGAMAGRSARYVATNENLINHALAPTMRWLIAAALDGATMTYGQVKQRLESEVGFSTVFATRIGLVAGELMNRIQAATPNAPLINTLVVNQQDRLPSKGAGSYMARRFGNPQLAAEGYKERHPAKWRAYFERAAAEVYAYSPEAWSALYAKVFGEALPNARISEERAKRHDGNEDDFGAGVGKYGTGGEGKYHKALRLWVTANPGKIRRAFANARTETEFCLDSGDRIDSVYHLDDRTVVLEVKSRISNEIDLRRGVYQCIKYRAVKAAMDVRQKVPVEAVLVTESEISGEIAGLLRQHGIQHCQVPRERE